MTEFQPFRGEEHARAVLTDAQVRKIRAWPKSYGYRQVLARLFGVSVSTIDDIRSGRTWAHLNDTGAPARTVTVRRGEEHGGAVLTEAQVREIRTARKDGSTLREIAAQHGVHPMTIQAAVTGKTWGHVS
jgi:hypothetical protein